MSTLRQLRLIIVGATLGAIGGSAVLGTRVDLRLVAGTAIVGALLLGLSFVLQRFASRAVPRLAPAYSSLIGRVIVTLVAALSVVLVFNVLVAPEARSVPARRNAQATVGPLPAAPALIGAPIAPASSAAVVPVAPSSAPPATVVPLSSPAETSPVSPFATPPASQQSPPPSVATAAPAQSVAPASPQPTPVSSPPSIVPTVPPLPTLPIRLP